MLECWCELNIEVPFDIACNIRPTAIEKEGKESPSSNTINEIDAAHHSFTNAHTLLSTVTAILSLYCVGVDSVGGGGDGSVGGVHINQRRLPQRNFKLKV